MLGLVPRRVVRREVGEDDVRPGPADGPENLQHAGFSIQESGCRSRLDEGVLTDADVTVTSESIAFAGQTISLNGGVPEGWQVD